MWIIPVTEKQYFAPDANVMQAFLKRFGSGFGRGKIEAVEIAATPACTGYCERPGKNSKKNSKDLICCGISLHLQPQKCEG